MRPTANNEIVFEGELEARVASQLMYEQGSFNTGEQKAYVSELLTHVRPQIVRHTIWWLNFFAQVTDDKLDHSEEFTCAPEISLDVVRLLATATEGARPGIVPLPRMKDFMGERLTAFALMTDEEPYRIIEKIADEEELDDVKFTNKQLWDEHLGFMMDCGDILDSNLGVRSS